MISFILLFGVSFAQVKVEPIYSSERFQPSDKFHAWCENQLDVVFSLKDSKINLVNAILEYDGNSIDILKILPQWEKENNLAYVVEDNKITFSKLKADWDGLDEVKFSLFFKVDENLHDSNFAFSKWSYIVDSKWDMVDIVWNYDFQFVAVPECNPDIVEPSVDLLFPSENEIVPLDSYFQFKVVDQWKWIDVDSINVSIAWKNYKLWEIEHEWKDSVLTVYPDFWLPFNSEFIVKFFVSDNQVYWNANSTTKLYYFKTPNEFYLLNKIDPVSLRKLLSNPIEEAWVQNECDVVDVNSFLISGDVLGTWDVDSSKYSVLTMMWWILFVCLILFILFGKLSKKKKLNKNLN